MVSSWLSTKVEASRASLIGVDLSHLSIFNLAQLTRIGPNTAVISATAIVVTIAKVSIIF
jgi:hypothetical protein